MGSMRIVAVVESDDYGPAVILDPEHISILNIDDFFIRFLDPSQLSPPWPH